MLLLARGQDDSCWSTASVATTAHDSLDLGRQAGHALGHHVRLTGRLDHPGRERIQPAQEWVLARPTGVGRAISTYDIPIEGWDEWLAAARRLA